VANERALRRRGLLLVLAGTVVWSLAGVFARLLAHLDVWTVLGWRAAFGFLSITVIGIVDWRLGRLTDPFGFGPISILIVIMSTMAISSYAAAVMTTPVADVLVIYATLPFVAAGLAFAINRERASRRTLIAAAAALVGVVIMVGAGLGTGRLPGQGLSLLMTVAFAGMVVLQRRQPGLSMIAVNALGALGAMTLGLAYSPHPTLHAYDFAVLFLYGLTTIGIGFVTYMEGAKLIPSAEAGLISMLDVVLGPLWVFIGFGENPGTATFVGGAIVLCAAIWRMAPELRFARATVVARRQGLREDL
jgi:drug/metabolite transporter (DMT)-like permease